MTTLVEVYPRHTPSMAESDKAANSLLQESVFLQHLSTYPVVQTLTSYVNHSSLAARAAAVLRWGYGYSQPVVDKLSSSAHPILKKFDVFSDSVLSKIDTRFPSLKTTKPSEVFEYAQSSIGSARDKAVSGYHSKVQSPISNYANAAKKQYDEIFDTQVDPRITPLNNKLEAAISEYLPEPESPKVLPNRNGPQLERTRKLAAEAASRVTPSIVQARDTAQHHILETYSTNLQGDSLYAKILAALATGRTLSTESYSALLEKFGTCEKVDAAVDKVKSTVSEYAGSTEKAVDAVVAAASKADADASQAFHEISEKVEKEIEGVGETESKPVAGTEDSTNKESVSELVSDLQSEA